jgi:hypothetical protein
MTKSLIWMVLLLFIFAVPVRGWIFSESPGVIGAEQTAGLRQA